MVKSLLMGMSLLPGKLDVINSQFLPLRIQLSHSLKLVRLWTVLQVALVTDVLHHLIHVMEMR